MHAMVCWAEALRRKKWGTVGAGALQFGGREGGGAGVR
jgi:hypothetical protein